MPTLTRRIQEAERRRLCGLPWLEKLAMLDKLRDRHLLLRQTRPQTEAVVRVPR